MNPFLITAPTVISFSGGRTSAYMLWRILQAHNMSLPSDALVCFANTGKEEEATLRFVDRCSREWGVEIHWLEYRYDEETSKRFKRVTFETAARNGEPFFELIDFNGSYLPNPVKRICTAQLKIRTIHKYVQSLGFKHTEDEDWVGIRADEMRRAAKIERSRTPLVTAKVTKEVVGSFWKSNSFDLELPNNNGVTMHGNCDLCFLKPAHQILSLIREKPERAIWWMKMEAHANNSNKTYGDGAKFRKDRPSYADMHKFALSQSEMFDPNEEAIACFCGD